MNLTEISVVLGTSRQNTAQTASRAIKKLFKNAKKKYKLSYIETYEMMLVGLNIYQDMKDVGYFFNNLSVEDKKQINKERMKGTV